MRALPGNPYDGHTLAEALEQVEILTDQRPAHAVVDRGYRGHGVETIQVLISRSKRGLTAALRKLLRRRGAIEPEIGLIKADGRLGRCPLKGLRGDAIFAVLCGSGYNLRKILNHIWKLFAFLLTVIASTLSGTVHSKAENNLSSQRVAA
jgi:IS5 family transposase